MGVVTVQVDEDIRQVPYTVEAAGITHGNQIPATSLAAMSVIGAPPAEDLEVYSGPTTLQNGVVLEGYEIPNTIFNVAAGAHVKLKHCRVYGPLGQSTYTMRAQFGGGLWLELENCEIVARSTTSGTPRAVTMWGDGNVSLKRTILRGGIDNYYVDPSPTPGLIETGDPFLPWARVLVEDSLICDIQRVGSSHSDGGQMDGGGSHYIRRSRYMGFALPAGSDPLTTRVLDPSTAGMASSALISTTNGAAPHPHIQPWVAVDSHFDGGNNCATVGASNENSTGIPAPVKCRGNTFGRRHQFAALLAAGNGAERNVDNRWLESGITPDRQNPITVVAGDLIPGSVAA